MRILHALEALEGGTALHVRTLAEQQVVSGHSVAVVIPPRRVWGATELTVKPALETAGAEIFEVSMHRTAPHPSNAAAAARLARVIRRWRPNVVHTHSTAAGIFGRPVAWALRVPVVHTPNGVRFADPESTIQGRIARVAERVVAPFTAAVIAVSASEGELLRPIYGAGKVRVVPNGVKIDGDIRPFPDEFTVVAVGRFVYQKDPELAVRVLAALRRRVPNARTFLVGYGALEPEVRALIAELDPGIEITQGSGSEAIGRASALLLASRWEGAPYVLLEAMNLGRPSVATDVVGSRDTIVHGQTGFLFPADDPDAGAELLARLAADSNLLASIGMRARERLAAEYSVEKMAVNVEAVYNAVGATPRRRRRV